MSTHVCLVHREQELLLVVTSTLDPDARIGNPVRGQARTVRTGTGPDRFSKLLPYGSGAVSARWAHTHLGFPGDHRVSGGATTGRLAGRAGGTHLGTLRCRRDALGFQRAQKRLPDDL